MPLPKQPAWMGKSLDALAPTTKKEVHWTPIEGVVQVHAAGPPKEGPDPKDAQAFAAVHLEWPLTKDQETAYNVIMDWALNTSPDAPEWMNLRGYAGTGKTTLVQLLSKALVCMGFRVIGLAPTHKAVGVLSSKVTCPTATIHSSSGLKVVEQEDGTKGHQRGQSMVLRSFHFAFLDECSMSGTVLTGAVEEARGNCRILTIGDTAQFNPVKEAQASPTFKMGPHVSLREITRQAEGNPLIRASKKVRMKIKAEERVTEEDLRGWLDPKSFMVQDRVVPYFLKLHGKGKDVRILAYRNTTVLAYNRAIHYALYSKSSDTFCVGEPVIAHEGYKPLRYDRQDLPVKNSFEFVVRKAEATVHPLYPAFQCWRLELGLDLEPNTGWTVCYVPWSDAEYDAEVSARFDTVRSFESSKSWVERKRALKLAWDFKNQWALIRHAYALTLHKSQGSTMDYAFIDLDDLSVMREAFEHGRALYVGFTRPREKVKFIVQ